MILQQEALQFVIENIDTFKRDPSAKNQVRTFPSGDNDRQYASRFQCPQWNTLREIFLRYVSDTSKPPSFLASEANSASETCDQPNPFSTADDFQSWVFDSIRQRDPRLDLLNDQFRDILKDWYTTKTRQPPRDQAVPRAKNDMPRSTTHLDTSAPSPDQNPSAKAATGTEHEASSLSDSGPDPVERASPETTEDSLFSNSHSQHQAQAPGGLNGVNVSTTTPAAPNTQSLSTPHTVISDGKPSAIRSEPSRLRRKMARNALSKWDKMPSN